MVTAHVFLWTSKPIKSCFITYLRILELVSYSFTYMLCETRAEEYEINYISLFSNSKAVKL
jgi:hypothetical protein